MDVAQRFRLVLPVEDIRAEDATGSKVRGADERAAQDTDAGGGAARGQDAVLAKAGGGRSGRPTATFSVSADSASASAARARAWA